jgi:hypothetical protein
MGAEGGVRIEDESILPPAVAIFHIGIFKETLRSN